MIGGMTLTASAAARLVRLHFGLVAEGENGKDGASFDALASWMRERDDVKIDRISPASYRALAESVREGKSDVAWLPPVVYAWLAEAVTPLGCIARGGSTSYAAALLAREGTKFGSVAELAGARAGWVDPWSAAGYVVPRIELAQTGLDPGSTFASETFYGSHREALAALARGDCDIAATYARTKPELDELGMRTVATFGAIPNDVLVVRRNLAPGPYERILAAFRHACADEAGRVLVRAVFGGDDLREGIEPGHAALRSAFERATANGLFD
ncbi:MAG: Phosphonate transporter phosphate-binding periplasmic component [Labilithrix sp.]|nr:Phosphonate transporter phosphate-binding periplasmic component [Labilithrix sp.]